jgi:hypothetical protein
MTATKWGDIDETGNEIIPHKCDQILDFHNGSADIELNGKFDYCMLDSFDSRSKLSFARRDTFYLGTKPASPMC